MPVDGYVVGRAADLPEGKRMVVTVNNRAVVIFNVLGKYYGLLARCPHRGANLAMGRLGGTISARGPGEFQYDESRQLVMCPWHSWEFDIATGQSYFDPQHVRSRTFPVEVQSGTEVAAAVEHGSTKMALAASDAGRGPESGESGESGRAPGPFTAETARVTVEDSYLVVSLRPRRPEASTAAAERKTVDVRTNR